MLSIYLQEKLNDKRDRKDHIQTILWTTFEVEKWDEVFKKENETIYIDNKLKMKYTIPNTSILYIQEWTDKN